MEELKEGNSESYNEEQDDASFEGAAYLIIAKRPP